MADKEPQVAFSALMKSLQCKWQCLSHVIPDCGSLFAPLDEVLTSVFFASCFHTEVTPIECLLF